MYTKNIFHFCRNHIQQKCVLLCLEKTRGTNTNINACTSKSTNKADENPTEKALNSESEEAILLAESFCTMR